MINIKLGKQAPALIWSGDHSRKMKEWPDLYQSKHCSEIPQLLNVPMALQMFSAPGTIRVKCPWHLQCSVPLALSQSSLCSILHPLDLVLVPPLLIGFQSISGWFENFPSLLCSSSWSPCSLWEWSELWLYTSQCPPLVTGQSPPALLVFVMVLHALPDVDLSASL